MEGVVPTVWVAMKGLRVDVRANAERAGTAVSLIAHRLEFSN